MRPNVWDRTIRSQAVTKTLWPQVNKITRLFSYPCSSVFICGLMFSLAFYRTEIVTGELTCDPSVKTTGTLSPGVTPVGITTFTWYTPISPGASPAKATVPGWPPMVAVTGVTV
jgi:hypothetical protein